jgi:diguanylate cyclase (GGDEF)-like protein
VAITRDVTERKSLEERLAQLALFDGLTGVANRRTFDESLDREWRRCVRAAMPLSLLLVDIDCFKALNDSQGHQKGDDCLRQVATALRNTVRRATDLVARYGGEEFVLLLPETDAAGAEAIGERIRAEIEALALPHPAGGLGGVITVSVGAATVWPAIGDSPAAPGELTETTDKCLYKAKQTGRNRVVHSMWLEPAAIGGPAHPAMVGDEAPG